MKMFTISLTNQNVPQQRSLWLVVIMVLDIGAVTSSQRKVQCSHFSSLIKLKFVNFSESVPISLHEGHCENV